MKSKKHLFSILFATLLCSTNFLAADSLPTTYTAPSKPLNLAVVNFKTCVEKSKMGQKEQLSFDTMKKQMENILKEKEKALNEVAGKFNDMDYLDSLSPDAEAELKRQYRTLNQEFTQQQNQFYQVLSQTNVAIIQKLTDSVTKASQEVAKTNHIDLVVGEDSAFYNSNNLDISLLVVKLMDEAFEKESKDAKPAPALDIKS